MKKASRHLLTTMTTDRNDFYGRRIQELGALAFLCLTTLLASSAIPLTALAESSHSGFETNLLQHLPSGLAGDIQRRFLRTDEWVVVGENQGYIRSAFKKEDDGNLSLSLDVKRPAPLNQYPQVLKQIDEPLKAGEVVRVRFWGRSSDSLATAVVLGPKSPPYNLEFNTPIVLSPEWKEFVLNFTLKSSHPASSLNFAFWAPRELGHLDLKNFSLVRTKNKTTDRSAEKNRYSNPFAGKSLPEDWWDDAEKRIRESRMGEIEVKVICKSHRDLSDAVVRIQQTRHQFKFGSAISINQILREDEAGQRYRKHFKSLFNSATPENCMKWEAADWHLPGSPTQLLQWCKRNGIEVRGHNLFSPSENSLPMRLRSLFGEPLKEKIREHISDFGSRFKGDVYEWDVLNEAVENPTFMTRLPSDTLPLCYQWAHAADPRALLAYNDFNVINSGSLIGIEKRERVFNFIKELKTKEAPLSTIGIQSHMQLPLVRGDEICSVLDKFSQFKIPISITEYDLAVFDDSLQAEYLKEFMTAIFSHPAVQSFTVWGFWEGAHYKASEGGAMIRMDWNERESMKQFKRLVFKDWWTSETLRVSEKGEVSARCFLGDYEITVNKGSKKITKHLHLEKPGQKVSVVIAIP